MSLPRFMAQQEENPRKLIQDLTTYTSSAGVSIL